MQMNRLFEIIYILLGKKRITAKELSEHFEVSQRTIYRDIETLSAAGIPIYTNKGKGGGISLLDNFVLNKSILSEQEQNEILMSLQTLNAVQFPDIEPVLHKLSTLFKKQSMNWIDVDFSHWGSDENERQKFNLLKTAIQNGNVLIFDYFSSYGEKTKRTIEPIRLIFKEQSWYIYGFCRSKNDFRLFKITRIKNLSQLNETFRRESPNNIYNGFQDHNNKIVELVLKIEGKMAYRIYDEFNPEYILKNLDGSFTVTAIFPEGEWIYSYVLSYGDFAEVLEPKHVRDTIKRRLENGLKKYL
ncbi:YafY family transcriptional regulator [Alkaliphilus sp. MSJ-5]|uniref:YafY family transcriptional regulator n=2 Tax=Alkaliphilus flagellatus TaxID=2841507 RepID=A0ABS6G394_9FIRM|nr:YafY family protein [Alkaliphilus flagellatus]MBU5676108.1 YafY family transcriptional regulator [Alkaliphilus flagellatus]